MTYRKFIFPVLTVVLLAASLSACSSYDTSNMPMASLDQMPVEVQSAPVTVQQAYQFAITNPDLMKGIPCFCGCGSIGHTSNYSCYINSDGSFDGHALGCSICVDITQDAMRLSRKGKTTPQIKTYVDSTYSKYGTSNMP